MMEVLSIGKVPGLVRTGQWGLLALEEPKAAHRPRAQREGEQREVRPEGWWGEADCAGPLMSDVNLGFIWEAIGSHE